MNIFMFPFYFLQACISEKEDTASPNHAADCDTNFSTHYIDSDADGFGNEMVLVCPIERGGDTIYFEDTNQNGLFDAGLVTTDYGVSYSTANGTSVTPYGYTTTPDRWWYSWEITDKSGDCHDGDPNITQLVTTYYQDEDQDEFGANAIEPEPLCIDPKITDDNFCKCLEQNDNNSCVARHCYSKDNRDCDDTDASINPTQVEIEGDGIDQDCNGEPE